MNGIIIRIGIENLLFIEQSKNLKHLSIYITIVYVIKKF